MKQQNRALIDALASQGLTEQEAIDQVDRVLSAIPDVLRSGKPVHIAGACQLRAKMKPARVGFPPNMLREQRKVALTGAVVLEHGEPYPDPRYAPRERSTYGRGL